MRREKISDIISNIDSKYVNKAAANRKKKKTNYKAIISIAASFCLLVGVVMAFVMQSNEKPYEFNEDGSQAQSNASQVQDDSIVPDVSQSLTNGSSVTLVYTTFEEACQLANTIVTARYVKSEPFGESYIRHGFILQKTIIGKAEKEINVFTSNVNLSVVKNGAITESIPEYNQNNISFEAGIDYLLILNKKNDPYMFIPVYTLINDTVVRLDNLTLSEMYHMPLSSHIKGMKLTKETTKEDIISYVASLTKNNLSAYEYIVSDNMNDIINLSDNIIRIKINGNHKVVKNEFRSHELYDCTVLEVLKGKLKVGEVYRIAFFPDTVKSGDEWIVAVVPLDETSRYLDLTSKKSLYPCNMKQDIMEIINKTVS